jgi:hypothetical protein
LIEIIDRNPYFCATRTTKLEECSLYLSFTPVCKKIPITADSGAVDVVARKEKEKDRSEQPHNYSSNKPTNSMKHSFSSETYGRPPGQ